jgi:hypothetical protein
MHICITTYGRRANNLGLVYGWSNISYDRKKNVTVLLFGVQTGIEVKHISIQLTLLNGLNPARVPF